MTHKGLFHRQGRAVGIGLVVLVAFAIGWGIKQAWGIVDGGWWAW